MEIDGSGNERKLHYIYGGDGLAAIFEKTSTTGNLYYIHKDQLGSYLAVTDETGAKVDSTNFDAWGRRRNPADWSFADVSANYLFDRGFTGHEHLDEFGLINMNGRVYDPILGRFLSPDNYIQVPDYSQSLNRYSYALNNPLIYTDPSGEFILELLATVVGSYIIGGLHNWINRDMSFKEAFAFRNNFIGSQLNISSDGSVSNPLVDAHNHPKQDRERRKKVEEKIRDVRHAYGKSWHENSSTYNVETYVIYGNSYSISNSLIGTENITRNNGISFFHDDKGNIAYALAEGRILTGKSIISYMVQNKINQTTTDFPNFVLNDINPIYQGPYPGSYRGIGQGAPLGMGTKFGHIEGIIGTLDFIKWMHENPEEVYKMQRQWYDYLNDMKNR
ncbi:MAG: RHS repeat domain-containing protein [bacterium]